MQPYFEHDKLRAYDVAKRLLAELHGVVAALPRGEREMADQLSRAASSVVLNTAEGAGRRTGKDKARFYDIARGSAAECGAALDVLAIRGLVSAAGASRARAASLEAVRLLAGLARSALARPA